MEMKRKARHWCVVETHQVDKSQRASASLHDESTTAPCDDDAVNDDDGVDELSTATPPLGRPVGRRDPPLL